MNEHGHPKGSAWRWLCASLEPDDGVDPRRLSRIENRTRENRSDRKLRQLCSQVERALELALDSTMGDPVLAELRVASVEPAPDASRLRAVLVPVDRTGAFDRAQAIASLERARGRLRCKIAEAITRRRAPLIAYFIAPADAEA